VSSIEREWQKLLFFTGSSSSLHDCQNTTKLSWNMANNNNSILEETDNETVMGVALLPFQG